MTDLVTLYRVEDAEGRGPYRITHNSRLALISRDLGSRHSESLWQFWDECEQLPYEDRAHYHPGPVDDPGLKDFWANLQWGNVEASYRFAFPSLTALGHWFLGEDDVLRKLHMQVSVLSVDAEMAATSEYQAVYHSAFAETIDHLLLKDVLL